MNLNFEDIYPDKTTKKLIEQSSTSGSGTSFSSYIYKGFTRIYDILSYIYDVFCHICNSFFSYFCFFLFE